MQVGVDAGIIAIVEKQIAAVVGDERLHGITGVAGDGYALGMLKRAIFRGRSRILCAARRGHSKQDEQKESHRALGERSSLCPSVFSVVIQKNH